jgi:hypothetical protein
VFCFLLYQLENKIANKHLVYLKKFCFYKLTSEYQNQSLFIIYTTKEFRIPTAKTKKNHKPTPEKTLLLFCVQPSGAAKTTGTPTTSKNDKAINAKRVN